MEYYREYIFDKLTHEKCVKLKEALKSIPQVRDAKVDFATCIAAVVYKKPFPEELLRMVANIANTSYRCPAGKARKWG